MKEKLVRLFQEGWGLTALSLAAPFLAKAQAVAPLLPQVQSLSGIQNFACTIVVNWLFTFLIILAVVFILVAAFRYLTAGGDPEKVKGASHSLIYAAVAIVVAILARAVPLIVASLFGISGFTC